MTDYRENALGQLEFFHNETQIYVFAVAPLQVEGGFGSRLVPDQFKHLRKSSVPQIARLALPNADTEYSFQFPTETKQYTFKVNSQPATGIRYAFASGIVADSQLNNDDFYYNVPANCEESETNLLLVAPLTIYFASSVSTVISIKFWV